MAVANEWIEVDQAFDRLETHLRVRPMLCAMRRLVEMIKQNPDFVDVHPRVTLASLILSRGSAKRGVLVAWTEIGEYEVSFVDREMELSESVRAREDAVIQTLRRYVRKLEHD